MKCIIPHLQDKQLCWRVESKILLAVFDLCWVDVSLCTFSHSLLVAKGMPRLPQGPDVEARKAVSPF